MLTIKNNEEVYSAPECMVISVKVQGIICGSLDGTQTPNDEGEVDF